MALVSGVGVPAGAVFDTMELHNDPSFEARGIMQTMDHPNGKFKMPAWPVRVDGKPPAVGSGRLMAPFVVDNPASLLYQGTPMDAPVSEI